MKKVKLYSAVSIIPFIFIVVLSYLYFSEKSDSKELLSLFYGFLFPTVNFIFGLFTIQFGFEKSDKIFLIIVFGGLIIRLFLMLALILMALKFLFVSLNSFIFTTFIFYFYYLIVEIFILTQKKNLLIKTKR